MNPIIYDQFLMQQGGKKPLFLDIKGFVLTAASLETITDDSVGVSSFQRDMMMISKLDELELKVARLKDLNPLNQVELHIELLFRNESIQVDNTGAVRVTDTLISEAVRTLYNKKFINLKECFPL